MSGGKFSKLQTRLTSPIRTTSQRVLTHEGGAGFRRDAKSEMFLLAVTNMVGEDTFYESAGDRDSRFVQLIHDVTREDPRWVASFIPYLRDTMQMRSASIVAAVEYGKAYDGDPEAPGLSRPQVVASALSRADEPAEMLAYYHAVYGRAVPTWLKRGINLKLDALYTERAALKYDGREQQWRFGDVIAVTHPQPHTARQEALYRFLVENRYGKGWEWLRAAPETEEFLPQLRAWDALNSISVEERRATVEGENAAEMLAAAGITWERLSSWLQGPMDARAWEAVIPAMGYMALLRNLRNFEDAAVSEPVLEYVAGKLADAGEVRRSRQLPFRFYSAYRNLRSERFGFALEQALSHSLENVPFLTGRTLILVDCSGSMQGSFSRRSTVKRQDAAGLFGLALAKRCESADVYAYGSGYEKIDHRGPLLRTMSRFRDMGGTLTWQTAQSTYEGHDRIVILTDEQAFPAGYAGTTSGDGYGLFYEAVPKLGAERVYTFNLAGYVPAHNEQGKDGSYVFGGLTDAGFRIMALLEEMKDAGWPWLQLETVGGGA